MSKIMGTRQLTTTDPRELPNVAKSLGPRHFPISHQKAACSMADAIERAGLVIVDQEHVVDAARNFNAPEGKVLVDMANLFSLFTVRSVFADMFAPEGTEFQIGFRSSIAQALSAQCCIGVKFITCTNISLWGDDLIFKRKQTTFADLPELMANEIDARVKPLLKQIDGQIEQVRSRELTPVERDATMFEMFRQGKLPTAYLKDLAAAVINPEFSEVQAERNNAMGIVHAATRVIQKESNLRRLGELSQNVSRFFGLGTENVSFS